MANRAASSKRRRGSSVPGKLDHNKEASLDRGDLFIVTALAFATLAVFGQVVSHQFIGLDDDVYLCDNPMVANGLTAKGIIWAFTTNYDSNWHPLTWISHMVDMQLFGLQAGWHLFVNVLFHAANTTLLFVFLRRETGTRWRSAMVAAIFALHPLHVESVAWAIERKDTLSTFFGLLSLMAYGRYLITRSRRHYVMVAVWLGLGLMAKPMLVTWPFLFLLLDYWPFHRFQWQPTNGLSRLAKALGPLIREKLPLFGLVAISMILTYLAQSHQEAVGRVFDPPFGLRVANALVSYAKYILLTFWPFHLAVYYPFPRTGIMMWQLISAVVLLGLITTAALKSATKQRWFIIGWLWYLGTLIPVIGLVQVGIGEALADRYHYVPSIGLSIVIVFGFADLANRLHFGRAFTGTISLVTLLLLSLLTTIQISQWRDTKTLFDHTLAVTSDNVVIEYNLGRLLGRERKYDQAIRHFEEALRINPRFFDALVNTGLFFLNQGKMDEAISYYRRALSVEPGSANTHMQLAMALAKQEKKNEAVQEFYLARDLAPNDADIRTNLGLVLSRQGKLSEATTELNEAIRLNPVSAEAHNNLGLVFLMRGEPEQGLPHFATALSLKPNFAVARDNFERAQREIDLRKR